MNIVIVGFGTAGKFYFQLIKKIKKVKKIYIINDTKIQKNSHYQQINLKDIVNKNISHGIIATPSNVHFEFAKYLLNKKVNLLIEKPFVLRISHAKELIKISKKKKLKCWTALQNRYNFALKELKRTIDKKKIGEIKIVDCTMFWSRDKKYYSNGWRGSYKTDGGVLTNQAIHLLDALIFIFGKIVKFQVMADFNKKKLEAEDLLMINFKHKKNIFSSLKATTRADKDYRSAIDVIGSKSRCLVTGLSLNLFSYWSKTNFIRSKKFSEIFSNKKGPVSGMGNGHKKILSEFLDKKCNKSTSSIEIENNLYILKVIHSIYNSILNKKNEFHKIKDKESILGKNE